jgi:hypothetical protein
MGQSLRMLLTSTRLILQDGTTSKDVAYGYVFDTLIWDNVSMIILQSSLSLQTSRSSLVSQDVPARVFGDTEMTMRK